MTFFTKNDFETKRIIRKDKILKIKYFEFIIRFSLGSFSFNILIFQNFMDIIF